MTMKSPNSRDEREAVDEYTDDKLVSGHFDFLDAKADEWMAGLSVQEMANAMASVFEKYASQEIMDRFREKLADMMHLCFVEGALRAWMEISEQGGLVRIIKPDNDSVHPQTKDHPHDL